MQAPQGIHGWIKGQGKGKREWDPCPQRERQEQAAEEPVRCAFCTGQGPSASGFQALSRRARREIANDSRAPLLAAGRKAEKKKSQESRQPAPVACARVHGTRREKDRNQGPTSQWAVVTYVPSCPLLFPCCCSLHSCPPPSPPSSRLSGNRDAQIADLRSPTVTVVLGTEY
jgi:hypothetical protein